MSPLITATSHHQRMDAADLDVDLPARATVLAIPGHPSLPPTVVDDDLLRLWYELAVPRPLSSLTPAAVSAVLPLVHDGMFGVLEDRAVRTGPDALAELDAFRPADAHGPVQEASLRAISLAAALPATSTLPDLASFMYRYNTVPILRSAYAGNSDGHRGTSTQGTDLATGDWLTDIAGLRPGDLADIWVVPPTEPTEPRPWCVFRSRRSWGAPTHKLYLAIHPHDLHIGLPRAIAILAGCGGPTFKVGDGQAGRSRADKAVVYFDSGRSATRAAEALAPALSGLRAQPVPFSVQLDENGLVSAGMDPDVDDLVEGLPPTSWRLEVCTTLAGALLAARAFGCTTRPLVDAVRHRAALAGIDTDHWAPEGWALHNPTTARSVAA